MSDLRKRRLKNFWAAAKFHQLPIPALRALLQGRKRLRLAREAIEKLPPHRRVEVARLAEAVGDTSELFQFEPAGPAEPMSFDKDLQFLRSRQHDA